jgi:hypothetical protein
MTDGIGISKYVPFTSCSLIQLTFSLPNQVCTLFCLLGVKEGREDKEDVTDNIAAQDCQSARSAFHHYGSW